MHTAQLNKRIDYIDIAKGIGIILVIVGHAFRDEMRIGNPFFEFVYQAVYFFHMPLFFTVSGLTFGLSYQKYLSTPMQFVKKRIQTQFIPVFSYASLIYICFLIAYQIPAVQQALSATGYRLYPFAEYLKLSALEDNPYAVHLWYLWILFIFSNIAYFCFRYASGGRKTALLFAAAALILYLFSAFFSLPVILERLFGNLIYFAAGILLASGQQLFSEANPARSVTVLGWLFMLVYCALYAVEYEFRILNQHPVLAFCRLFANILIIDSVLRVSRKLVNCTPLLYCGRESYPIYLLHQPFCCGFVGVILYNKLRWPALLVYVLCCVLSILLPAIAVAICRRVKPLGKLTKCLFNIT